MEQQRQDESYTEVSLNEIAPEQLHEIATREMENLRLFLSNAKTPALVIAGVDTTPDADGGYRILRAAVGSADAILQLTLFLQNSILQAIKSAQDAMAEKPQRVN